MCIRAWLPKHTLFVHVCTGVCVHSCRCVCVCVCVCAGACTFMQVCVYVCRCVCICVVHASVCMCLCTCVHMHVSTCACVYSFVYLDTCCQVTLYAAVCTFVVFLLRLLGEECCCTSPLSTPLPGAVVFLVYPVFVCTCPALYVLHMYVFMCLFLTPISSSPNLQLTSH